MPDAKSRKLVAGARAGALARLEERQVARENQALEHLFRARRVHSMQLRLARGGRGQYELRIVIVPSVRRHPRHPTTTIARPGTTQNDAATAATAVFKRTGRTCAGARAAAANSSFATTQTPATQLRRRGGGGYLRGTLRRLGSAREASCRVGMHEVCNRVQVDRQAAPVITVGNNCALFLGVWSQNNGGDKPPTTDSVQCPLPLSAVDQVTLQRELDRGLVGQGGYMRGGE